MVKRVLQRKDANAEAWLQQRDGEEWAIQRDAIDCGAIGYRGGFEAKIHALMEWQDDVCRCRGPFHREDCNRPRQHTVDLRRRCPGRSLTGTCFVCEHPPNHLLFESELCRIRPGAIHPLDGCDGCVFSYVGELELDKSLKAAGIG